MEKRLLDALVGRERWKRFLRIDAMDRTDGFANIEEIRRDTLREDKYIDG